MHTSHGVGVAELSVEEMQAVAGGDMAYDFWKAVGYAVGKAIYYTFNGESVDGGWSSWHA
jgi:hypothetical protein